MPYATAGDGTALYYEVHGQGAPLIMIMGLGMNATGWYRNVPALAARFQVIVFDNRGTGRSDKPDQPYTLAGMAADAAAVLEALSLDTVYVLGASMGGYIAQELALHFPARVRCLILACTSAGGQSVVMASDEVIQMLLQRGNMTPEQAARASIPFVYAPATIENRPDLIEEDIAQRLLYVTPAYAYGRQLQACLAHDTWERLPQIKAPTLVMHGDADLLVPAANAQILAGRIAGAALAIFPAAGHMFFSEAAEAVNAAIVEFLTRQGG